METIIMLILNVIMIVRTAPDVHAKISVGSSID